MAVGTELAETDSWVDRLPLSGDLVRIDIDAAAAQRDYPASAVLLGDAGFALTALTDAVGATSGAIAGKELAGVRKKCAQSMSSLSRMHMKLLDALRGAWPDDAIVVTDMTQIA